MSSEQMPQLEDLVTVRQAASEYEMGESTVWLLIKRHELDRFRVPGQGKKTFVRRADLDRALRTPVPIEPSKKAAA